MDHDEKTQVNFNTEPFAPAEATTIKKKSKKIPMLIGIVAAVAVLVVLLCVFIGASSAEPRYVAAKYDEDGTAYLLLEDGKCITINDDVCQAVITADRKNVMVVLEDGTLYVTDKDQSKKTVVAENVKGLFGLRDEGFFYDDVDNIT